MKVKVKEVRINLFFYRCVKLFVIAAVMLTGITIPFFYPDWYDCIAQSGYSWTPVILTDTSPDVIVKSGDFVQVLGTSGTNNVTLEQGSKAALMNFPGENKITIKSDTKKFFVSRSGAMVIFEGNDSTYLEIPATSQSQTIEFNDGSFTLIISSGRVMLEKQVITTSANTIDALISGTIELTENLKSENVIITNFSTDTAIESDGSFTCSKSRMLLAGDVSNKKLVYFSYPSTNLEPELNAKETAIALLLETCPFWFSDGDSNLDALKQIIYSFPEVQNLEEAIEDTINSIGYLDATYFLSEYETAIAVIGQQLGWSSSTLNGAGERSALYAASKNSSQAYSGGVRLDIPNPISSGNGYYKFDVTAYNSMPIYLGLTLGTMINDDTYDYVPDSEYYFLAPMDTSSFLSTIITVEGQVNFWFDQYNVMFTEMTLGEETWNLKKTEIPSLEASCCFDKNVIIIDRNSKEVLIANVIYRVMSSIQAIGIIKNKVVKAILVNPDILNQCWLYFEAKQYDLLFEYVARAAIEQLLALDRDAIYSYFLGELWDQKLKMVSMATGAMDAFSNMLEQNMDRPNTIFSLPCNNLPPVISDLSISPLPITAGDPLNISFRYCDPDGLDSNDTIYITSEYKYDNDSDYFIEAELSFDADYSGEFSRELTNIYKTFSNQAGGGNYRLSAVLVDDYGNQSNILSREIYVEEKPVIRPEVSNLDIPSTVMADEKFNIRFNYDHPEGISKICSLVVESSDPDQYDHLFSDAVSLSKQFDFFQESDAYYWFGNPGEYTITVYAIDCWGVESEKLQKTVSVTEPLISGIVITGPSQVNEGSGAFYTCTVTYSNGDTEDVTGSTTWSENSGYASIAANAYLSTLYVSSDQTATITASYGGKSTTKTITIKDTSPTLSYLTISGSSQVDENSSANYTCTATYSDGSTSDVTSSAAWSENSSYASINSGYLTTWSVSSDQTVTITASYGGKSTTKTITIKDTSPTLSYLTISGSSQVDENSSANYTCTATYSDGTTSDVISSATWSENSSYASIGSNGYLSTSSVSSDQTVTITASYMGKTGTYTLTIKNKEQSGDFVNNLDMTFKLIPAGTFMMGSPSTELGRSSNETRHQVTLSNSYYIQTTEVTQGQWKAVMGSNPSYFSSCGDDCPVDNVSWNDVQEFITRLNAMGQGTYSLPTEAQWEYAARAGSTTAFANGDITDTGCSDPVLGAMGWYCGNANRTTHQVARKSPNAWGLYDMHGNVWEWCQDWYGSYSTSSVTDPVGPLRGSYRVFRGGSWYCNAWLCRSAIRGNGSPDFRFDGIGFRLVLSPGQ